MKKQNTLREGFTLIEILVVIGIIALLAAIVIIAINPARQFAQARNSQRSSNVNTILNAVGQNIADNKGNFVCGSQPTATATVIGSGSSQMNIRSCIVPTYVPEIPVDPDGGTNDGAGSYNTLYTIEKDSTGRIKVCAPKGVEAAIAGSTAICVTR